MKRFTGTKTLDAKPMTRGEYNAYRGWDLPSNENGDDVGYLVEYVDGGKGNDSRHVGYISWSPADVFNRTYTQLLPAYQQRVIDESAELGVRLTALKAFIYDNPGFDQLDTVEQAALTNQALFMTEYLDVLQARIGRFLL